MARIRRGIVGAMAFTDLAGEEKATRIFQESLRRERLAHAYLITSASTSSAEKFALQIAKTLNCEASSSAGERHAAIDSCDQCPTCRQTAAYQQADVSWIRPESKSRMITIQQIRNVLETVHLKAHGALFKVFILVGAERMNAQASNAFLKTLEEPPARSILLLLSSDSSRLLPTILSRCLRIPLSQTHAIPTEPSGHAWIKDLCHRTRNANHGIRDRYHVLSDLLSRLSEIRSAIEEGLSSVSPLERHDDLEPKLRERYKQELAAAIEAEYRRQRSDVISILHWFLRDIWLQRLNANTTLLQYPALADHTQAVASRISEEDALRNLQLTDTLQRQLNTNVQEALALEVALLKICL